MQLVNEAFWQGICILLCGPTIMGLLPFVEKLFDVQTDLSLLHLGDMNHPLLRELAQRAPGTYNHSISVAALAESAADSIGAHGLLVRVGACFHDIGKMFKPNYFVENQAPGSNRHDTLQPAMSTLVIIAHVKDGSDLGRKHGLPGPIIDFIEQHHGTTLVEYFYRLATKKSEQDPNGEEISESTFRYPGPKPQTKEAAVLMIADAVESASRALVEPTASRLQNLVEQIAMKKLLDGQFDECGLTLQELDTVKRSLIKSLTAIYHGRIKYPDQQSAG
jgi:putative nucleotidyltransferase with HDIG domain